jgi:hypothetical protein
MPRSITLFTLLVLFIVSCKKEADEFYLTFSPEADLIVVNQEKFTLNLKQYADVGLSSLEIYLSSDNVAEQLVELRSYNGNKLESASVTLQFDPTFERGSVVYGRFVLTNSQGESIEYLKRFDLTLDVALTLYEDLSFYSYDSDLYNAFSLSQATSVTFDGSNSQGLADLIELSNDTSINPYALSYKWYSPTNCGIAHVPNLDFYSVTKEELGVVFNANVCMEYTDSLTNGDVYVFKKIINDVAKYYAIRITDFSSGSEPGRYQFDLRK